MRGLVLAAALLVVGTAEADAYVTTALGRVQCSDRPSGLCVERAPHPTAVRPAVFHGVDGA